MRRRSRASGEPVKVRHRKTATPKRRNAPKSVRGRTSPVTGQEAEVARLNRELNEAREQQTATAELLRIISSSPTDTQPVFDTIVRNFVSLCGSLFGTIFTFDGQFVHFAGAYGFSSEQLNAFRTKYPVHVNDSSVISARAILARAPVHIHDIMSDPYYDREHAAAAGEWRRMLGVPMLREGVPLGAIVAAWSEAGAIPKQHEDLLKVFAAQAVIAIENVRLFEAEQQRAAELTESLEQQTATSEVLRVISSSPGELEPVFQAMLANAVRICDAKFGIMLRYDNEMLDTVALFGAPPAYADFVQQRGSFQPDAGTALDRLLRTKDVVRISDAAVELAASASAMFSGARSLVSVPMLKENVLIGAITIYRQEVRPFTDKQIALVQNFAAQAVIAIENTRLLNELRESLDRQTATADILRVIAGTPEDSKRALDTIAETAVRMFDASAVNFRRIEGDVLRLVGSAGPTIAKVRQALSDLPLEPTDPAVRSVFDNRQISIEDRRVALANERGEIARILRDLPVRSQAFTPLSRRGEAIGVMIVSRSEVRPFAQGEFDLMTGFADQAVIAIENARLLKELRERTNQLEAQSQEVVKLNQQLEKRVADQVGEIERMGRLRRFLPPQVADLIVASGTEKQLESHRREITALFCDLRGFTGFSESSDPEDVMALLREYHAAIGEIIIKYSGTLERFAGDGVMVVFNDPVPVPNPALQAVQMALDMRVAIGALIEKWRRLGHDLGFGMGIAHGYATLGTIGFEGRFDYAAIGTVSNVASRLCDEAKPGQILISPRVLIAVEGAVAVEPVGDFALKGIRRPMSAHNVLAAVPSKN